MDEVYYKCWESSPEIENFMKQHQMQHINEVENYYIRKTIQNVKDIGYKYILYQDPADNNVTVSVIHYRTIFNSFIIFLAGK